MIKNIFGSWGHTAPGQKGMEDIKKVIKNSDLSSHEKFITTNRFLKLSKKNDKECLTKPDVKKEWNRMLRLKQIKNGAENIFFPAKGGLSKPEIAREASKLKKEQKMPEQEKLPKEPKNNNWSEALKRKLANQEQWHRGALRANENNNKLGGLPHNRYAENESNLDGIKSNGREALNSAPGRGIPHEAPEHGLAHKPPEREAPTPHTEPIGPPSEFNK